MPPSNRRQLTPQEWQRISATYESVVERAGADRDAILKDACNGDEWVRREVESLLAESDEPSPLDRPVWVAPDLAPETRLSPGERIGPYEVEGVLGAGGMGTVYRARDTKLGRAVALKLPAHLALYPERMERFRSEAQILAALNHPNIGAIYGFEETPQTAALVLELVEGETLADRITRGRLEGEEFRAIAEQIAEALEAAHEQGIVHCDLKPLNVKITPAGHVKVLDFGLARLAQTASADAGESSGPLIGTAAYLSPEQVQGKAADRRSDIWAFGCVAYEMLTGHKPFEGKSVADVLASVVRDEPDWNRLPVNTPPGVRRVLRRCLVRNPRERLQHIGDARLELTGAGDETAEFRPRNRARERWAWGLASLAIGVGLLSAYRASRSPVPVEQAYVDLQVPPTDDPSSIAISPDGHAVAYTGAIQPGRAALWIRRLDSGAAQPLPGTEGAQNPFWSPDGRSIGYFADQMLKRIDVESGVVQSLARASGAAAGGSWSRENMILFVSTPGQPVRSIPARGGEPRIVTPASGPLELAPPGMRPEYPSFLPDGQHFLFYVAETRGPGGVYVGDLSGAAPKRVFDADSAPVCGPGVVLFVRSGSLLAQRFDQRRLALEGSPRRLAERVFRNQPGKAAVAMAEAGAIVYRSDVPQERRRLVWFDRAGKELGAVAEPLVGGDLRFLSPALSPDERWLAMSLAVEDREGRLGVRNIWLLDLLRGVRTRLTTNPDTDESKPVWSPNGQSIIFTRLTQLVEISVATNTQREVGRAVGFPTDWSPDGKFLLVRRANQRTGYDIFGFELGAEKPFPVVQTDFDERDGEFSPDGRWIAFQSNESGRFEIYVQPFRNADTRKVQVSTGGGAQVRWPRDGKELFYIALDGGVMAAPMRFSADGRTVEPGAPARLFAANVGGAVQNVAGQQYVVSADGRRFLMNTVVDQGTTAPLRLILHWRGL